MTTTILLVSVWYCKPTLKTCFVAIALGFELPEPHGHSHISPCVLSSNGIGWLSAEKRTFIVCHYVWTTFIWSALILDGWSKELLDSLPTVFTVDLVSWCFPGLSGWQLFSSSLFPSSILGVRLRHRFLRLLISGERLFLGRERMGRVCSVDATLLRLSSRTETTFPCMDDIL